MAYRLVKLSDLPSLEGRADDELLTIEEAAAYVGLSPATLNNWRTGVRGVTGGPPWIPLHNGPKSPVRYRVGAVRAWLAAREVRPGSEETPAHCA